MGRRERRRAEARRAKQERAKNKADASRFRRDREKGIVCLQRVVIDRAAFNALPEAEQTFLVLVGQAGHELHVLTSVGIWALNGVQVSDSSSNTPESATNYARFAQAFYLLRLLASRLWEGWRTLQKAFFGSGVSKTYETQLDAETLAALEVLKSIFSRSTPLKMVRDKFGSHSDPDVIRRALSNFAPAEEIDVLVPAYSRCFAAFADRVTNNALLENLDPSADAGAAVRQLLDDAAEANGAFQTFVRGCLRHAATKCAGSSAIFMELPDVPQHLSLQLPYFALDPTPAEIQELLTEPSK